MISVTTGVVWLLYQNPNRYCGDGQDPCPLIPPAGVSIGLWIGDNGGTGNGPSLCPSNLSETSPVDYHDLCHWPAQNVTVTENTFSFNPSDRRLWWYVQSESSTVASRQYFPITPAHRHTLVTRFATPSVTSRTTFSVTTPTSALELLLLQPGRRSYACSVASGRNQR